MHRRIAMVLALWVAAGHLHAQTPSVEQLGWLTGYWLGDGFGGVSEEMWGKPMAGQLLGSFRHVNEEQSRFSEILQISEENGTLILRLKHFNPDLTSWEEKDETVDFPLVELTPGRVAFKGLVYELVGEDQLRVTLTLHDDGRTWDEVFNFRRQG